MRGDVIEIQTRGEILLVGGAGTLSGLPAPLRQRSVSASAVQRLSGDTQAIHHLRHFWLRRSHPRSISLASDRDLLDLVAAGVSRGDVDVVVLPAHLARPRRVDLPPNAATATSTPLKAGIATIRAPAAGAPPALVRPLTITPRAAPPAALFVNRMTLEERLGEVLRRTAGRLPRAVGQELLSLVTPESIGLALGLAAFGAAAEFTPVGWAADVILAAIAFGFGGLAAVHALGDLVTCFARIFEAQSERDLDEAAEALARAASAITVMGLAAILHEKASSRGRGGGGAEAPVEESPAASRSRGSDAADDAGKARQIERGQEPPTATRDDAGGTKVQNPKWSKSRPSYEKDQVQKVWDKAKDENGDVYDPNTGEKLEWDTSKSRAGQWDMGHMPGNEYRNLYDDYASGRISEDEFLRQYRDPDNFQPESVSGNRSRRFEQK